jgi:threonyl-tRNA synthetase
MRKVYQDNGYKGQGDTSLRQTCVEENGHWGKYRDNMFTTESEKQVHLKPMN